MGKLCGMTEEKKKRKRRLAGNPWPERLKALRKKLGITQVEAAQLCGVATSTWNGWEYGFRIPAGPSLRVLQLTFPEIPQS